MEEITQEFLQRRLDYDAETGVLKWKPVDHANSLGGAEVWNKKFAGKRAGWVSGNRGYRAVAFNNRCYPEHRIIWLHVYGRWPEGDVDHINCVKGDNRLENLREASRSENSANRPPPKSNKSGVKGVHFDKGRQKWMAYIKKNWKRHHLGRFDTMEEAIAARRAADESMNGEFARAA